LLLLIELNQQVTFFDMASAWRQLRDHQGSQSGSGEAWSGNGEKIDRLNCSRESNRANEISPLYGKYRSCGICDWLGAANSSEGHYSYQNNRDYTQAPPGYRSAAFRRLWNN
jgi:hypothetical protein